MNGKNGNGRLTASTVIPIGAAASVLFALLAGYAWLDDRLDSQDTQIHELKMMSSDRWRASDMKLWFEMLPPELKEKFPDPWSIIDKRKKQ